MPAQRATSHQHELDNPSRRRAVKAAAATGTAALIWSEPSIVGLARRPAYADVGSATETITLTTNGAFGGTAVPGFATGTVAGSPDVVLSLTIGATAVNTTVTIGVTGCVCTITGVTAAGLGGGPLLQVPDPDDPFLPPQQLAYVSFSGATLNFALADGTPTAGELLDGIITLTCT